MMARAKNAKSEDIRETYQILAEKWNQLAETASSETSVETGLVINSATGHGIKRRIPRCNPE